MVKKWPNSRKKFPNGSDFFPSEFVSLVRGSKNKQQAFWVEKLLLHLFQVLDFFIKVMDQQNQDPKGNGCDNQYIV